MSQIPEGTRTVSGEGRDLAAAIASAASELDVDKEIVGYKLDMNHFRSGLGTSKAVRSVKIIAWADESLRGKNKAAAQRRAESPSDDDGGSRGRDDRKPRSRDRDDRRGGRDRDRDRDDRRGGRDRDDRKSRGRDDRRGGGRDRGPRRDEGRRGAADGTTEASDFSQEWFSELLEHMNIEGKVEATGDDERVHLDVRAEKAGRVIGKRGATLAAIRHILGQSLDNMGHEGLTIDVDVADERGENRSRKDRDDDRGGDRKKGKRRRRDDRGEHEEKKLQALARRAAERVLESGKPITINLKLNSYDRRLVHVEVSEIDGVTSRSEEREGGKVVQVLPE